MRFTPRREEPLGSDELAEYSKFGFSEKFSRLLHIRGINTAEKIQDFLDFSHTKLHDPFKLSNMREAVSRVHSAIIKKERILIIGDYDCDGICATAILYKYLLTRYARTKYFLPNRDADGYGLTIELIDKLHKQFNPQLIITVDCGVSCPDEIEHAKGLGIDCIITDHHAIPERTPECLIINPKLPNQEYPFNELCGAGVSLKLVQALEEFKQNSALAGVDEALKYIDIATLATVADIVPLRDENRVLVHEGLKRINADSNPAITALAKSCNVYGPIKSQDISYKLGPKINAAGRMGVAKRGLDLLLEKDPKRIDEIIQSLSNLNMSRQKITNNITDEAERMITEQKLDTKNLIIVHKENWEGGVLGIVAARITDRYHKPAVVLSKNDNIWKGSARSIRGINMVEVMTKLSSLLVTFGGHTMAAGLSLTDENLPEFKTKIQSLLDIQTDDQTFYEFSVTPNEITSQFINELELLEPVGCENQSPVFLTTVTSCFASPLTNFPKHIRFSTKNEHGTFINFTMFGASAHAELLALEFPKQILFEFQKSYDSNSQNAKALARVIIPQPNDQRSEALTLQFALQTGEIRQIKHELSLDRNLFIDYYRELQKFIGTKINGVYNLYTRVSMVNPGINPYQFVFVIAVLRELNVLNLDAGTVRINQQIKANLEKSKIYNSLKGAENAK